MSTPEKFAKRGLALLAVGNFLLALLRGALAILTMAKIVLFIKYLFTYDGSVSGLVRQIGALITFYGLFRVSTKVKFISIVITVVGIGLYLGSSQIQY